MLPQDIPKKHPSTARARSGQALKYLKSTCRCFLSPALLYAGFCLGRKPSRDDHLSAAAIARCLSPLRGMRRGARDDGTIIDSADPNPPCFTMSLPIPQMRDPRFPRRFTPIGLSRGEIAGFVSVALVLTQPYRICVTRTAVSRMAFQRSPDVPPNETNSRAVIQRAGSSLSHETAFSSIIW